VPYLVAITDSNSYKRPVNIGNWGQKIPNGDVAVPHHVIAAKAC